jgi:hypothetical protein
MCESMIFIVLPFTGMLLGLIGSSRSAGLSEGAEPFSEDGRDIMSTWACKQGIFSLASFLC